MRKTYELSFFIGVARYASMRVESAQIEEAVLDIFNSVPETIIVNVSYDNERVGYYDRSMHFTLV